MRFLSYLWRLLLAILRALAYEWILALVALGRRLCELVRLWWSRRNDGRARKVSPSPCNPIDEPAFHRPDPMIYSQYDLMAQGFAVTWDNPDIILRKDGVGPPSSSLVVYEAAPNVRASRRDTSRALDADGGSLPPRDLA